MDATDYDALFKTMRVLANDLELTRKDIEVEVQLMKETV